jgi:mannose-6-phosphate isomerase-like protein (cupin superfamily)
VEDAYFVLEGCVTVGWEEAGHTVEQRLRPKDFVFNPAGRVHYFRNDGVADAEFTLLAGTARAGDVDRAVESRDWGAFGTELDALRPLLEELSQHSSGR